MGFERESFDKLMKVVWGKKSQMQQAMSRDSKGEPFIIRELEFKGAQTPSQLATALKVTSGRISTLLAALEKKGLIEREVDPDDRRIVHVNLTEQGRAKAKQQREDMRDVVCWVFSQMGERRTREFVDLTEEFATYVTICIPGQPRPTAEEVKQAFAKANTEDPDVGPAGRVSVRLTCAVRDCKLGQTALSVSRMVYVGRARPS